MWLRLELTDDVQQAPDLRVIHLLHSVQLRLEPHHLPPCRSELFYVAATATGTAAFVCHSGRGRGPRARAACGGKTVRHRPGTAGCAHAGLQLPRDFRYLLLR